MSQKTKIVGNSGKVSAQLEAQLRTFRTVGADNVGLVTLNRDLIQTEPSTAFFFNPTVGIAMNQNVSFGGTPEVILDGAGGGWTPTAVSGSWNFTDSGKVTITSANNGDSAMWDDAGTIDMNSYTAISGKVDLDVYSDASNTIQVQFGLAGAPLGNPVNLDDFIDTGVFTEQSFIIPKASLGIDDEIVDEMIITIFRTGGTKPTIKFDDWQIEQTGTPLVFSINVNNNEIFHLDEIVFTYADALAGTLADGTMPALSYNKILGVSALPIGFNIIRAKGGKTLFSAAIRTLGTQISAGGEVTETWSDGTNTFVVIRARFAQRLKLTGDPNDFITITINDDMSGLLQFTCAARGGLERSDAI